MNRSMLDLLRLVLDKTRGGLIPWIFRPTPHGGIGYGLGGALKLAKVEKTFMFSYYRVGHPVVCYTLEENKPGWFLTCQIYALVSERPNQPKDEK